MSDHAITQSMLGNADKCLRSFQYAMQRPTWVRQIGSVDRAIGTGFHAGLAHYYTKRMETGGVTPNANEMIDEALRIFVMSTTIDLYDNTPIDQFKWSDKYPDLEAATAVIEQLIGAYVSEKWYVPANETIIAVELNESYVDPNTGRRFKLGADLVTQDAANWINLYDHKTAAKAWPQGKDNPRKQNQSPLYTWAARNKWPDAAGVRFAFDIITLPGPRTPVRFERRITEPTPAHEHAVITKAVDLVDLYDVVVVKLGRDLPANPASTLCNPKWCDYWDGCPHGAVLDRDACELTPYQPVTIERSTSKNNPPSPTPTPPPSPSEGATVDTVADIRAKYDALDEAGRTWVNSKRAEALAAGYDFHLSVKTERRAAIMTGLVALATAGAGDDALAIILEPYAPSVGHLNHTTAREFADACRRYIGQPVAVDRVAELFGATTEGAA